MKRTVTYDDELCKIVPIVADEAMGVAGAMESPLCIKKMYLPEDATKRPQYTGTLHGFDSDVVRHIYAGMLAAVPANLPGVIEHSGEPCAWTWEQDGKMVNAFPFIPGQGDKDYFDSHGFSTRQLYLHPPATATLWRVETLEGNRYFTHAPTPGVEFSKSGYLRTVAFAECGAPDSKDASLSDADLLSWLNANPQSVMYSYGYMGSKSSWCWRGPDGSGNDAEDLRNAIRSAIAAIKKEGE